jgi:hypothetical protein
MRGAVSLEVVYHHSLNETLVSELRASSFGQDWTLDKQSVSDRSGNNLVLVFSSCYDVSRCRKYCLTRRFRVLGQRSI